MNSQDVYAQPAYLEGKASTDELAKRAAAMWLSNPANKMALPHNNKAADADGDGLLDKSEFQQMFDLDGDGQLSQHELAKAAKLFAMVDKDGDGQLTEEELKQVHLLFDPVFLTIRLKSCTDAPRALL